MNQKTEARAPGGWGWPVAIASAMGTLAVTATCAAILITERWAALNWIVNGALAVSAVTAVVGTGMGLHHGRCRVGGLLGGRIVAWLVWLAFAPVPALAYALGVSVGRWLPARRVELHDDPEPLRGPAAWHAAHDTATAVREGVREATGSQIGTVLGWSLDGAHDLVTAAPEGGVLVIGPPRSGKTSGVLIPTLLMAPGAAVSTSIKGDVMAATWAERSRRGTVWHFDPAQDEATPGTVQAARWSPLVEIRTWDDALRTAQAMAQSGSSAQRGDSHWTERAATWLACLLWAAHVSGRDIAAVAGWSTAAMDEAAMDIVVTILAHSAEAGTPDSLGSSIAADKLMGLLSVEAKERSSIASTLTRLMAVYDSVGARQVGMVPNFDARTFVRSGDTLYVTAAPDKQQLYAPLLAALLEAIRLETYRRHKRIQAGLEPAREHVTFVLDEAANTAPIPLPAIISEAGGQGLHLAVGLQAVGQAIHQWGKAAESFLTLFPTKVLLRGNFDADTLGALSRAAGDYDRERTSWSRSTSYVTYGGLPTKVTNWNPSYSSSRERVLTEGDLNQIPEGCAMVWRGPDRTQVRLGMHWREPMWQTVDRQAHEWIARRAITRRQPLRELTTGRDTPWVMGDGSEA